MAASEHAAPDRERAETYLRLLAEAELRRGLAMPEYKPPGEYLPARVIGFVMHRRRMRRRRAIMRRIARERDASTGGSQSGHARRPKAQAIATLPAIRRVTGSLAKARAVAAPATTATLRAATTRSRKLSARVAGSTWPLRRQIQRRFRRRRHRGYEPPPAEACLERVETLADVLAAVGAITAQTGEDVVGGLRAALAARSRIEQDYLVSYHPRFRGHPMRRPARGTASSAHGPRAFPIGVVTDGQVDGHPVRFCMGVLLQDNGSATLTLKARLDAEIAYDHDPEREHPLIEALNEISASDDRGASYHGHFNGGGGGEYWDFRFAFRPALPASARWLDVVLPGAGAVRVRLDAEPADLQVTTEPVAASAADRFLDRQTLELLLSSGYERAVPGDNEHDGEPTPFWLARHLLGAGVLTPDSASLRRLIAVARSPGEHLPEALSRVQPDALPADWLSLQAAAKDRNDGPAGMIPVAAVLPEVDGARCVIGELVSGADTATLYVHCAGWPEPRRHGLVRADQFWWTARDDLGGWYVLEEDEWSYGSGEADLGLRFNPVLDPQARTLDIILSGTSTQVTVTVPLGWLETL